MNVTIYIIDGPLPDEPKPLETMGAGAVACFDGVVRPSENDRPITGLEYETYDPMTENTLRQLSERMRDDYGLIAITVEHSRGAVPNGARSFRLQVSAAHRKEALAAMDTFIDRMKRDIPIWKRPLYADPQP